MTQPTARRHRRIRRRWWVLAILVLAWSILMSFAIPADHRAYLQCEAHPGPGIVICMDGGEIDKALWIVGLALAGAVLAIDLLVLTLRRTLCSVDRAVDRSGC